MLALAMVRVAAAATAALVPEEAPARGAGGRRGDTRARSGCPSLRCACKSGLRHRAALRTPAVAADATLRRPDGGGVRGHAAVTGCRGYLKTRRSPEKSPKRGARAVGVGFPRGATVMPGPGPVRTLARPPWFGSGRLYPAGRSQEVRSDHALSCCRRKRPGIFWRLRPGPSRLCRRGRIPSGSLGPYSRGDRVSP